MTDIREKLLEDILFIIKDNLQILIANRDSCLYHFMDYCDKHEDDVRDIPQYIIIPFVEECLYSLLNANFLYDFRDIE